MFQMPSQLTYTLIGFETFVLSDVEITLVHSEYFKKINEMNSWLSWLVFFILTNESCGENS